MLHRFASNLYVQTVLFNGTKSNKRGERKPNRRAARRESGRFSVSNSYSFSDLKETEYSFVRSFMFFAEAFAQERIWQMFPFAGKISTKESWREEKGNERRDSKLSCRILWKIESYAFVRYDWIDALVTSYVLHVDFRFDKSARIKEFPQSDKSLKLYFFF